MPAARSIACGLAEIGGCFGGLGVVGVVRRRCGWCRGCYVWWYLRAC